MRALVTGGALRLGREMALYLARQGYDVAVHFAQSEQEAQSTVLAILEMGQNAVALQADLLDEDQTSSLIKRAVDGLGGRLDILVNNALYLILAQGFSLS